MDFIDKTRAAALVAATLLLGLPHLAAGQDDGFAWRSETELSFVSTSGNAGASTMGLKGSVTATGGLNEVKFEFGGIRSETTTTTRTAVGTGTDYTVNKTETSQLTAANYFARGRYDRSLGAAFVFGGAGWDRNTFAGIENRYQVAAGVGRTWVDGDTGHFKTDVAGTYTIQKDVEPEPGVDDHFAGVRASIDAERQITEAALFASVLIGDMNGKDTDDYRADWINSLSFNLSSRLAFKTAFQMLYAHQPALIKVPLFDTPGGTQTGDVLTPGEELDTILTLTLVIKI